MLVIHSSKSRMQKPCPNTQFHFPLFYASIMVVMEKWVEGILMNVVGQICINLGKYRQLE